VKPTAPETNPGGFKTKILLPRWQDGDWPFMPWYGLGYAVNDSQEQAASSNKQ
jgi:hypothetical protein